jgi:hypothetical protein
MDYSDGKTCPYCNNETKFVDSIVIYGRSYGMVYYCEPCKAWCGVHKGTDQSLGRLANSNLRELKKQAHAMFDPLWQRKIATGLKKNHARAKAYIWLAKEMGIEPEKTHVGMFDEEQCKQVIEICKPYNK